MKKIIISALFFGILFTACKNKSNKQGKTEVEKTPDINTTSASEKDAKNSSDKESYTFDYLYKSNNGEIVTVTFFEEDGKMYIKVKRDDQTDLTLEQTTASAKGAEYENGKYKWISQKEDATFSDGKNTMKLTVISPLEYRYTSDKEAITVIYFSKNDKRFVTLKKDNKPKVTLKQTTAWAKGAEYGKDSIQWHTQRSSGTLIEDGIETKFKRKE